MKSLLIDNYDSFTYNLFQLLSEANGEEPIVVRNDELSWEELAATRDFDNIVISPGPGNPDREADFGVCADAIRHAEVPLLGVCLGHQGLCSAYGAKVVHAPEAMHGRISAVTHEDSRPLRRACRASSRLSATTHSASSSRCRRALRRRLDQRRDPDGGRPPGAAAVGSAVPSRVDLHRARPGGARSLPRPHRRALRPPCRPPSASTRLRRGRRGAARGSSCG